MSTPAFESATESARRIRSREIGCVELLDYFIRLINDLPTGSRIGDGYGL
jgi:hypothetical protein